MIYKNLFFNFQKKHFKKFKILKKIYIKINNEINLISKKSLNFFFRNHIQYSLSILNLIKFLPKSIILDAGTGGGFPGIPLSIIFPKTKFYLLDSIKKKILKIKQIKKILNLKNIILINNRIENYYKKFDFVISRFLSKVDIIYKLLKKNIKKKSIHYIKNGIIYLTGDNNILLKKKYYIINLFNYFKKNFYKKKKIIYIPI